MRHQKSHENPTKVQTVTFGVGITYVKLYDDLYKHYEINHRTAIWQSFCNKVTFRQTDHMT